MNNEVNEFVCPICKAPEVAEGRLNIRAFKVLDEQGRWWSQCISGKDHGAFTDVSSRATSNTTGGKKVKFPASPWFTILRGHNKFAVSIGNKIYHFQSDGKE